VSHAARSAEDPARLTTPLTAFKARTATSVRSAKTGAGVEGCIIATVETTEAESAPASGHPVRRIVTILAFILFAGAFANLVGWDIRGWFQSLWDTLTTITIGYIVAGIVAMTVQTTATAYGWYAILSYAYPGEVRFRVVLAAYAAAVGLNNILPANLGTIVMFVMFTTVIASATFAGLLGGFGVQKIFFSLAGIFVYLYLFLSVGGSFDISFSFIKENPWATAALLTGGIVLLVIVMRSIWQRILKWWEEAKDGGRILTHPRAYFGRVFLPSFIAWVAGLCIVAIFLAAYAIPVTFHTVMTVVGGNSIANTVSVTPGGVGVQQAFNVASLNGVTDAATATAYSVAQQLISTAWSLLFAIVLMVWVFGWGGGKSLLTHSYAEAKERAARRKETKEAAEAAGG
jgi:uncharacterized membrane protein YbhN (UPF0104 family)